MTRLNPPSTEPFLNLLWVCGKNGVPQDCHSYRKLNLLLPRWHPKVIRMIPIHKWAILRKMTNWMVRTWRYSAWNFRWLDIKICQTQTEPPTESQSHWLGWHKQLQPLLHSNPARHWQLFAKKNSNEAFQASATHLPHMNLVIVTSGKREFVNSQPFFIRSPKSVQSPISHE